MAHDVDVIKGAAVIASALLVRLHGIGIAATIADIEWNDGRGLVRAPEMLMLRVAPKGMPAVVRIFRRGELEDAALSITWHVQRQIDQIVTQYVHAINPLAATPPPAQPPQGGPA
jgi:hypothetical protein